MKKTTLKLDTEPYPQCNFCCSEEEVFIISNRSSVLRVAICKKCLLGIDIKQNWTKVNTPPEEGDYIGRMDNAYIKMVHYTGEKWLDMWKDTLDGTVVEYQKIPS